MITRYFLRPFGIVIPETAISLISFDYATTVEYAIADGQQHSANPLVETISGLDVRASITITDPDIIALLNGGDDEDADDEEEDEEEEEVKPRKRGRPSTKAKVEEKEEPKVEPFTFTVEVLSVGAVTAQTPLNESDAILRLSAKSEKNARVINAQYANLAGRVNRLEDVHMAMERETVNINEELSASVGDMIPGSMERTANIEATAVDEYRRRQRRQEGALLAEIEESHQWFANQLTKSNIEGEYLPLSQEITLGSNTYKPADIVKKFFAEDMLRIN